MFQPTFTFSVFGNRYFFTPKFIILSIALILLLIGMGIWQLQRGNTIEARVQLISQRLMLDPVQASNLDDNRDLRFYPVQLTGSFDNDHTILLSNRVYKGQRGYEVVTPFKVSDQSSQILVDRGWIPLGNNAGTLPSIQPTGDNNMTITGILYQPSDYYTFGSDFNEKNIQWPLISKRANIEKLSEVLDVKLFSYIVLLSPNNQYGFVREWTWLPDMGTAEKYRALAKQWFVLAFVVLMIFVFTNIHRA